MRTPSWATAPSKFTREERKEWQTWLDDPSSVDMNKNRFTCSGSTSWGGRIDDVDEMYDRMVARGVVAAEPKMVKVIETWHLPSESNEARHAIRVLDASRGGKTKVQTKVHRWPGDKAKARGRGRK